MIKVNVGDSFTAIISNKATEGKIQIQGGVVYLCQNTIIGAGCTDKLGYDYSWCTTDVKDFNIRNLRGADVIDFILKGDRKSRIANFHKDEIAPVVEKKDGLVKVIRIADDLIEFEGGIRLYSYHEQDCCESHYLSTADLTLKISKDLNLI